MKGLCAGVGYRRRSGSRAQPPLVLRCYVYDFRRTGVGGSRRRKRRWDEALVTIERNPQVTLVLEHLALDHLRGRVARRRVGD